MAKKNYKLSKPGANESISYPSTGPVRDEQGQLITSDHSILTDVDGQQAWLHAEKHHHTDGEVHMPIHHAVDMGLPNPHSEDDDTVVQFPEKTGLDPATAVEQQPASGITQQSGIGTTTPGSPSYDYKHAEDRPKEDDKKEATPDHVGAAPPRRRHDMDHPNDPQTPSAA